LERESSDVSEEEQSSRVHITTSPTKEKRKSQSSPILREEVVRTGRQSPFEPIDKAQTSQSQVVVETGAAVVVHEFREKRKLELILMDLDNESQLKLLKTKALRSIDSLGQYTVKETLACIDEKAVFSLEQIMVDKNAPNKTKVIGILAGLNRKTVLTEAPTTPRKY